MFESVFYEVSILLFVAAIIGFLGMLLRQPLIVSFILVGILVGPSVLGITRSSEHMELLASLGVSLLLFIVGLKLDLKLIRMTGRVALMTGLGQVVFTSLVGYWICLWMGFSPLASLYIAIALTFSSTIIIVKLLSDKGEMETLHGRIALGFLIVQDIVVVLMMIGLSTSGLFGGESNIWLALVEVAVKGVLFLAVVALFIRYVAERLLRLLAPRQEMTLLFVVAWAAILASATDMFGFSKELGALLAGVSFASTSYRDILASRLTSLRDFLLLFFFINLGAHIHLAGMGAQVFQATLLSLFVLIGNPFIVLVIMGMMGYTSRTGFLAGLTVAQISEFSLVFVALGLSLGHIDSDVVSLVTLVGLLTIGISTYMILNSHLLYSRLSPFLAPFERKRAYRESHEEGAIEKHPEIIVIGLGRYGRHIALKFHRTGKKVMGIDYDPHVVREITRLGVSSCFGDIHDPGLLSFSPLLRASCILVTIPALSGYLIDPDPHMTLCRGLREAGFSGKLVLTARSVADLERFKHVPADMILYPYEDAAEHACERIQVLLAS